jgi:hypothetical protein
VPHSRTPAAHPPCNVIVRDGPVHGCEHHLPALWQVQAVCDPAGAIVHSLDVVQVLALPQAEAAVTCTGDVLVDGSTVVYLVNLCGNQSAKPAQSATVCGIFATSAGLLLLLLLLQSELISRSDAGCALCVLKHALPVLCSAPAHGACWSHCSRL